VIFNLGMLDSDRNRYSEAEGRARQALEMRRKLGGDQTPTFASSLVELAEDRVFQGDPQSAVPMLRQALEIRQQKYSAGHPAVISAEVRLGEALMDEGEAVQAEPVLQQALASARTAPFPLLPWQMAEAESALGACLVALHRYSEGQILLRDSESVLRTIPKRRSGAWRFDGRPNNRRSDELVPRPRQFSTIGTSMDGAYIAHFGRRGDYATLEDRRLENAPIPWDVSQSQTSVPSRSMAKV
jgi:tetratricopeptide (TPR) repeat protein